MDSHIKTDKAFGEICTQLSTMSLCFKATGPSAGLYEKPEKIRRRVICTQPSNCVGISTCKCKLERIDHGSLS